MPTSSFSTRATFSISEGAYRAYVRDVLNGLAKTGFRTIVIINGHGGPQTAALNDVAREVGQATGKRTLVVRFGRGFARAQFATSLILALTVPLQLYFRGFAPVVMLPLGVAPLALRQTRRLAESKTPVELIALLGDTGKLLALYAVLLSVGVIFS